MNSVDFEEKQFFARWFKMLFIIMIISVIASMMASDIASAYMPSLVIVGNILGVITSAAYAIGLIVMARYNDHYKTAGMANLLAMLSSAALMVSGDIIDHTMNTTFSIILLFLTIFATFMEFTGHVEVTRNRFGKLSQQWSTLWKWTLAAYVVQLVSAVILFISIDIAAILILIYALIVLVTGVLKVIMLYRTASFYAN